MTSSEAAQKLQAFGPNILPSNEGSSLRLLLSQFNFLTLLLFIAATTSFLIGDWIDGILILIILTLNSALGFWQEYKASKELAALRKLEVSYSRVIRDGQEQQVASAQLVPGDLVILSPGDKVPADGKIIESADLEVNQSSLTGESLPVLKSVSGDSELFFGTVIVGGRAKFEVTKTGKNTRFGSIALTLSEIEPELTPLEVSINSLAKKVAVLALILAVALFVIRYYQGYEIFESLFTSTALLVAVVPEGLPAILSVLLALGARRLYKLKALVRKMSSIESLGATGVICTDKTGTLTLNQMQVKEAKGSKEMVEAAILCNSASLVFKDGLYSFLGDTTEGALLIWAQTKVDVNAIRASGKVIDEKPFDLKSRMMSVVWQSGDRKVAFIKGAPEVVLPLCKLSETEFAKQTKKYQEMAGKGLRVLAFAKNKTFLGLIGIADAARPEAREAIKQARMAGVEVVMITGDNELTAKAIAEELELIKEGDEVLTGSQLQEMSERELQDKLEVVRVFARVYPEHKLKIVQAYQRSGKVVTVTGDGINDALALKQAQVGVAMGITGTDVAKEASDIIILDDNLATIVSSIAEGRTIFNNTSKVTKFLMTGNLSEGLVILITALLGYPTALLPVQLLWINLVTDGLPALSLAADPASSNVMRVPPRNNALLDPRTLRYITTFGLAIAAINVAVFVTIFSFFDINLARNSTFTVMVVSQMVFVFILRRHHSITSNKYLLFSVGLVLLLQALIIFFQPRQLF